MKAKVGWAKRQHNPPYLHYWDNNQNKKVEKLSQSEIYDIRSPLIPPLPPFQFAPSGAWGVLPPLHLWGVRKQFRLDKLIKVGQDARVSC